MSLWKGLFCFAPPPTQRDAAPGEKSWKQRGLRGRGMGRKRNGVESAGQGACFVPFNLQWYSLSPTPIG